MLLAVSESAYSEALQALQPLHMPEHGLQPQPELFLFRIEKIQQVCQIQRLQIDVLEKTRQPSLPQIRRLPEELEQMAWSQ